MKLLITGATGFLGSHVARELLEKGHELRAVHRASSSFDLVNDIRADIEWVESDVLDPDRMMRAMAGMDGVVHGAAYIAFGGKRSRERLQKINVGGTANVVNCALASSIDRLLHVSSIAALGRTPERQDCIDESAEWVESELTSEYARSKYLSELEIHRGIAEGLDAVMVNPSLIMGPGRSGENTTEFAEKLLNRKVPFMPPGSTNVVDVEDVADGVVRALAKGRTGERYILAGANLSWNEIITILCDALSVRPPSITVPGSVLRLMGAVFEFTALAAGKTPVITRETTKAAAADVCYENEKAIRELGCNFRPFEETAARIAASLGTADGQ